MTIADTAPAPAPALAAIPLSAPVNLRDLAGIPIAGGAVREGFAIRADDLSTVTEAIADQLVAAGLSAVIDLRSADEVLLTGRGPFAARTTVNYHHVPFMTDLGQASDGDPLDQRSFGRMYVRMFENAAPQIVTALAIIAHAPGAVAFHCAAGQDRTGVLAASLLLALGADRVDILADYARTGANSAAIHERIAPVIAPLMAKFGFDLDQAARAAARAEFSDAPMRSLLDELGRDAADPLVSLRSAGLTDGLVARLRERAVAEASA